MRRTRSWTSATCFESSNHSELSSCFGTPNPNNPQCTFDFTQANFATNPQLTGFEVDIAEDPIVPDRDLFVFNTTNDALVDVVDSIGTLLYGLTVDSAGKVFVAQTDARNLVNGRAGTQGKGLVDLENRMFLNRIGVVRCPGGNCGAATRFELEPLPPSNPTPGTQLATPYGIAVSGNYEVLIVTAASSSRVAWCSTGRACESCRYVLHSSPRMVFSFPIPIMEVFSWKPRSDWCLHPTHTGDHSIAGASTT